MEANLSFSNDVMPVNYQQAALLLQLPDAFSFQVGGAQNSYQPMPLLEGKAYNNFSGTDQWPNKLGALNEQNDVAAEKREPVWQRTRWTNEMVRLLITAASYVEEFSFSDANGREKRKQFLPPRKGKWRVVSCSLVERGFMVSPQQCEDKFHEMNKKCKRLNDILGMRMAWEVVDNPTIMEMMDICDHKKQEVEKILSCKQLSYRELFSYHNKNKIFLPHDEALHSFVLSTLQVKDEYFMEAAKRQKLQTDYSIVKEEQAQRFISRSLELNKKMVKLEREMLELEKEKMEWLKACREEEEELIKVKQDTELLKLDIKHLEFEISCRKNGRSVVANDDV